MKIEKTSLIEHIRDGLLYIVSIMIIITLFVNFKFGIYFVDSQKVYLDYLIFGIGICILHLISDKITILITTKLVVKAVKEKKQLNKSVTLVPYFGEVISDFVAVFLFAFLSTNVAFDYVAPFLVVISIRCLNGIIDPIMGYLFRKENLDGTSR